MNYMFGMAIMWLIFGIGGWLVGNQIAWAIGIVSTNIWIVTALIVSKVR